MNFKLSQSVGVFGRKCWLAMLFLAALSLAHGEERIHTVKRNDTLYSIARQYGLSTGEITARNDISRMNQIYVGQRLILPTKSAAPAKSSPSPLSPSVQVAIDKAKVAPQRWKYIVIHHSGVDTGNLKSIDRYHREERHMEHGLAYHFLIGNGSGMGDGEIAVGRRWQEQLDGGHLASAAQNKIAIGICLIGNFDEKKPTDKQMQSLENLVRALRKRCSLSTSAVKTHQQINVVKTRCPGTKFPAKTFFLSLQAKP